MSPEITAPDVSSLRSRYAFLFGGIAELCRFQTGKKPSTKFDDIVSVTERLYADGSIDDYLYSNLKHLFSLYPSLLPSAISSSFSKDKNKTIEKLVSLGKLLDCIIGDVCGLIQDITQETDNRELERIIESLNA